jgi:hypothetical protein
MKLVKEVKRGREETCVCYCVKRPDYSSLFCTEGLCVRKERKEMTVLVPV